MICEICKGEFKSDGGLHNHLKKTHKMDASVYYKKYFPRHDKYDGKLLIFKNKKDYFAASFNSFSNFKKFLYSGKDHQFCLDLCKEKLIAYFKEHNCIYAPTEVELLSKSLPSIDDLIFVFGGYENYTEFLKQNNIKLRLFPKKNLEEKFFGYKIYVDTREQKPFRLLGEEVKQMKLSIGDYTCDDPAFSDVFIERKSLQDLVSTMSSGFDRFYNEVLRAEALNHYLVVLVESNLESLIKFKPITKFKQKITGGHVLHNIRDILRKHKFIQFLFTEDVNTAESWLKKIFNSGGAAKEQDLQYFYNLCGKKDFTY